MGKRCFVLLSVFVALMVAPAGRAKAKSLKLEIDLTGEWRVEIGDDPRYRDPDFDDTGWERIAVPSAWENEGFPGYDGYAWYRIHFTVPAELKTERLYLRLGRVDDVDEVFLNGIRIGGKGSFPPKFKTAWDDRRTYRIPPRALRFDAENVLAVRVYDVGGAGGIVDGPVGIFSRLDVLKLALDLSGKWKFEVGDDLERAKPGF
ncbi:MAG: glycoside hydrolase, partial [Calditrichaeota bacterium]|nr:glycoside hydrolase [Calditrichota bacterium]